MKNLEEMDVPVKTEGEEENKTERKIKTNSGNKTNAVYHENLFAELMKDEIAKDKE